MTNPLTYSERGRALPTVICTYPKRSASDELKTTLEANGVIVVPMPLIETKAIEFSKDDVDELYDWLIFTSRNAVRHFFDRYSFAQIPSIAVIGESTGKELRRYHLKADFIANAKSSGEFIQLLQQRIPIEQKVLIIQGKSAPMQLYQTLIKTYKAKRINVYTTEIVTKINQDTIDQINQKKYSFIIVTSPSAGSRLKELIDLPEELKIISIGKTTTSALEQMNINPVATAKDPSFKCLAETTLMHIRKLKY